MISSMWRVSCALVYIFTVVEPSLISQALDLVGQNEVNLGSYNGKVHIGILPSLYRLTDEDEKTSFSVAQTLEKLRPLFSTGLLSIPSIDPYKSNKVKPIIISEEVSPIVTGKIEIHEVVLHGGKSFNLKSLQIRMNNDLRIDFDVSLPSLYGHVVLHADLKLGSIFPIHLNIKINFNIKEVSVNGAIGAVKVSHEGMEVYQLQNLHANIHADEVHVSLKGLGRSMMQDILRFTKRANLQNAPSLESTKTLINNYAAKTVMEEINKILSGFSINQIKSFFES